MKKQPLKHRDINWLYFNERVLLEAQCKDTPLLERLKFLAIFSSNLDEFFKVRVSQLRQLKDVEKSLRRKLALKGNKTLKQILSTVAEQQRLFGKVIEETLTELRDKGVFLREIQELDPEQHQFLQELFNREIKEQCQLLDFSNPRLIKDGALYLVIETPSIPLQIVEIPSKKIGRFIALPGIQHNYIYLDNVVRLFLSELIPNEKVLGSYSIKISRDAELYLDDDYTDTQLVEKIYDSLGQRKSGQPTRLLFDAAMPAAMQQHIQKALDLGLVDMVAGGRYHNLSDFFEFDIESAGPELKYNPLEPLPHPVLSTCKDMFKAIQSKDQLVHFPYQQFDTVERFIAQAAQDDKVNSIKISLYRIAKTSALTDSILKALENGKEVLLFVEAQARFDEANNIKWGRTFEDAGAKVLYSVPNIKVHSKIALVTRIVNEQVEHYAYIGTGNFNAKTARIYCDHGLFTAHKKITSELNQVFEVLERKLIIPKTKKLLVSPFSTRNTFMELIQNEITNAEKGLPARITAKMNSLEDTKMITAIEAASKAGVEVRLLVRGFCRLIPKEPHEVKGKEKPIYITSIIDRFLEHGRIYLFENGGKEKMYIGSADWMTRNLDRRIEVLTPILDKDVFEELKDILQLQMADNVKARVLDANDTNRKVQVDTDSSIRSQYAIYNYLKNKYNAES